MCLLVIKLHIIKYNKAKNISRNHVEILVEVDPYLTVEFNLKSWLSVVTYIIPSCDLYTPVQVGGPVRMCRLLINIQHSAAAANAICVHYHSIAINTASPELSISS